MEMIMKFGEMPLARFRELVEWLDQSPFDLHRLDIEGIVTKGDVKIQIQAPKVNKVKKKEVESAT